MKKVSLNQWILAAGIVTLGFSCQSKKSHDSTMKSDMNSGSDSQCEEPDDECDEHSGSGNGYGDDNEAVDESEEYRMSNVPEGETDEKVSLDPIQTLESVPVEKQEEATPAPSLTESKAVEPLSLHSIPELEFMTEEDLQTLGKLFSIEVDQFVDGGSTSAQ